MVAATQDYIWPVGEDLTIQLVYKTGPAGSETPVDLTGYQLRMDINLPNSTSPSLYVVNSASITDTDPITSGSQGDTNLEATLGADGTIAINLSRSITMPGGALWNLITDPPGQLTYEYDMFLRTPSGTQRKILKGQINIEKSVTKWA